MEKVYKVSRLFEQLKDAGLPCSRMWLRTVEAQEKFKCSRLPGSRRDRVFSDGDIEEIIEAFSVGGEGEWFVSL